MARSGPRFGPSSAQTSQAAGRASPAHCTLVRDLLCCVGRSSVAERVQAWPGCRAAHFIKSRFSRLRGRRGQPCWGPQRPNQHPDVEQVNPRSVPRFPDLQSRDPGQGQQTDARVTTESKASTIYWSQTLSFGAQIGPQNSSEHKVPDLALLPCLFGGQPRQSRGLLTGKLVAFWWFMSDDLSHGASEQGGSF